MCCSFSGRLGGAFLASLGAQKCNQKVRKLKPILGPHSGPEIGFSDSALWPGNTNRKVKPVLGFNNEAQNWLQFSPKKSQNGLRQWSFTSLGSQHDLAMATAARFPTFGTRKQDSGYRWPGRRLRGMDLGWCTYSSLLSLDRPDLREQFRRIAVMWAFP